MSDLITPTELKQIADEIEMKKARQAFDIGKKKEEEEKVDVDDRSWPAHQQRRA